MRATNSLYLFLSFGKIFCVWPPTSFPYHSGCALFSYSYLSFNTIDMLKSSKFRSPAQTSLPGLPVSVMSHPPGSSVWLLQMNMTRTKPITSPRFFLLCARLMLSTRSVKITTRVTLHAPEFLPCHTHVLFTA